MPPPHYFSRIDLLAVSSTDFAHDAFPNEARLVCLWLWSTGPLVADVGAGGRGSSRAGGGGVRSRRGATPHCLDGTADRQGWVGRSCRNRVVPSWRSGMPALTMMTT